MPTRSIYLAKYRTSSRERAHFAVFIPNAQDDRQDLSQTFKSHEAKGTIIQVIGEPLMSGYILEFKRNYECSTDPALEILKYLGSVEGIYLFEPESVELVQESTPRSQLEREAQKIPPPRKGQDVRAPIDGVNTRRCQEWTTEFVTHLADLGMIERDAIDRVQSERDTPTYGIFGY
ncbi:hypothetical protein CKM354_000222300 [Cercospora kikuchii]|uniref:Uncharacterized protein n=1 Tax=Cercospora kikuchii TaxID=84275 RepID=A0A9P3FCK4_9PEZI|nr:uncharacterized protein CKM354_000222300 [Cercospora kikuchii]GIZ38822.1 hypothetical protein CKM354_000222300 [Cercospora kikuchii]